MPPGQYSRYLFCQGLQDANGKLYLSERVPFRFVQRDDNIFHIATAGDSLFTLAAQVYAPLPSPAQFYWAIADYQKEPIIDASLKLALGRTIVIPSRRTLLEEILSESRRPLFSA
jgi:hypothetical protein